MAGKFVIKKISAMEILDSRGVPTISVKVELAGGVKGSASVPSGTSAGSNEAVELRDRNTKRFGGKGVLKAVANVNKIIFPKLKGRPVNNLQKLDSLMMALDRTPNKSRLGANAILGVSLACARAGAHAEGTKLYRWIRQIYKIKTADYILPRPMFNILNGGLHAESGMDVQEFMLVPKVESIAEAVRYASETFSELKKMLQIQKLETGVGLEGGFAPRLANSRAAIEILLEAAKHVGLPSDQMAIALDVAASGLYDETKDHHYVFRREKATFSREQLIAWYGELAGKYPIMSVEDGLEENDWKGWQAMHAKLGKKVLVVGDDITVTSPTRLKQAIKLKALNAIIIKPNQIGTLSETMETIAMAHKNNIATIVSHRSGDTTDPFIADLAVAVNSEFIKSGSVSRGERVAKYNRLMEIEQEITK